MHRMACALAFERYKAGRTIAAKIPMMPITTSNSTSVKPARFAANPRKDTFCVQVRWMVAVVMRVATG